MAELPEFIVNGEWVDPQPHDPWKLPRSHPYDWRTAYQIQLADGRELIFPDHEAAVRWQAEHQERANG